MDRGFGGEAPRLKMDSRRLPGGSASSDCLDVDDAVSRQCLDLDARPGLPHDALAWGG